MKTVRKFVFGYRGIACPFWLNASSERHLLRQLAARGMAPPDWMDPATTPV